MRVIPIFFLSLAAALVGALAWIAAVHYLNVELGLIAWGIGLLAGVGARFGAREIVGRVPGILAVLAAIIGIGVGKVGSIALAIGSGITVHSEAEAIPWIAVSVANERTSRGEVVNWPPGVDPDQAWEQADYPADVWAEAVARWRGYSDAERDRFSAHPVLMHRDLVVAYVAADVSDEWVAAGNADGASPSGEAYRGSGRGDYPEVVWTEAERRWETMPEAQRTAVEDRVIADIDASYFTVAMVGGLMASFSLWDLLWVGLAGMSAYRLGHGPRAAPPEEAGLAEV